MRFQLSLNDLAFLAGVNELNRVFEADDVQVARFVEVIDHRGKRRGFTGTGRAGDQHHALVVLAEFSKDSWHIQLLERWHVGRNMPKDGAVTRGFAKDVDAETAAFFTDVGEIEVLTRMQLSC